MNNTIALKFKNAQAVFNPEIGMNLLSLKKENVELIDQSTRSEFEQRMAGLGPIIGPHFHRRKAETVPKIKDDTLFPHIARVRAKGIHDPFSHGISRYAPWKIEKVTDTKVEASLSGKMEWNGVPLQALEGQNFTMKYSAELNEKGLLLFLSVVSDTDSLVGIHFYYALPKKEGTVIARIQDKIIENNNLRKVPSDWNLDGQNTVAIPLNRSFDCTLYPYPNPLHGDILLKTSEYQLRTKYFAESQENAWQLYHPENASFVCIEPVSAQDPRHPNLTVSSIRIELEIEESHA